MKQTNERLCALAQKGDAAALDSLIDNNKSFIGKDRRKLVKFFISVSVLILIMKQDLVIFQLKC